MLDLIRSHIPAARTMSDGRLTAILIAFALLFAGLADLSMGMVVLLGVAAGVWYAQHQRHAVPFIRIAPDAEETAEGHPSGTVPVRERVVTRAASHDPLVARAEALLRRVSTRG